MKIKNLLHNPVFSGGILMVAAILAMIVANSSLLDIYQNFIHAHFSLGVIVQDRFLGLDKSVHFWVNDVLMAVFFLLVGMEIKRELVIGELSSRATALQPVFAAIGGVVVPIAFFFAVNWGDPDTMAGWAVPCATDIAFALGVLALLGKRVPPMLAILLTAIAIIDDLIAILVIGLFYTADLQPIYLVWALLALLVLVALNIKNVQSIAAYMVAGFVLWIAFYKTGLHPTMAGVVTALTIPVRVSGQGGDKPQRAPLLRLEHGIHPWVAFLIVPLFAFVNAGLDISATQLADFGRPLTLGIMLGLMLGKPLGIMAGLYLGHVIGVAKKPVQLPWKYYTGIAFLCGIGFTMSLFIGELGFESATYKEQVKLGVLTASLCMAVLGWFFCRVTLKTPASNTN